MELEYRYTPIETEEVLHERRIFSLAFVRVRRVLLNAFRRGAGS